MSFRRTRSGVGTQLQFNGKCASPALLRGDKAAAAVHRHDLLDARETSAGDTLTLSLAGGVIAIPYVLEFLGRDSVAVVGDGECSKTVCLG